MTAHIGAPARAAKPLQMDSRDSYRLVLTGLTESVGAGMPKLAQLARRDDAPRNEAAELRRIPRFQHRFYAFLSYSHKDKELADWLHRELERFRVPRSLRGRLTGNGVVPARLTPIFRDQHDLSASDDLGHEIKGALNSSQFLVVLCSPASAKSQWVNAEIELFKRTRPDGCVLAAIAAGEPFAGDFPGREDEECFPPALKQKYDRRGRPTGKRAEPLAADFRASADGRRLAFLKLVAGMLGVALDDLVQRETTRRHRRLGYLAAASLAGMAVTSTLAITAIQARDAARDQRREAEGLVAFMLGDLKDKLEPIGKLDALDGVGSRVLAYYGKQDASELSDAALLQRSRALSLMAEVSYLRGDLATSSGLYRQAMLGTAEAMRRNPDDPTRIFDHAQNVFYVGEIALNQGRLDDAERQMREYKSLALKMVALGPDNMKWRMEEQYAEVDLGLILLNQRRFSEAAAQFTLALNTIDALTTADPSNGDYQKSRTESLAWLAEAQSAEGRLAEATIQRERQVALLNGMLKRTGDVVYRQKLIAAERGLGNLYGARGQVELALQHFRAAVDQADQLTSIEPDNALWLEFGTNARLDFATYLMAAHDSGQASSQGDAACKTVGGLLAKDPRRPIWRAALRDCWTLRGRIALAGRATDQAVSSAQKAVAAAKSVESGDSVGDRYALAETYRLLGDAFRLKGDRAAASAAWNAGMAVSPTGAAERPSEAATHAILLQRLGHDAGQLTRRLAAIGYRNPVS